MNRVIHLETAPEGSRATYTAACGAHIDTDWFTQLPANVSCHNCAALLGMARSTVADAAGQRMADTITWQLEALASATTRDEFDFLVLGAPRELLSVMRSLDADGLIADITPEVSVPVGGGSELDTSTAPASGDGQRPNRDAADLPAADVPRDAKGVNR